jgi:hypothetical protein
MPWMGGAIAAGGSLLGGALGGSSANKAAKRTARAMIESAKIAAEASAFKPVGMTTRFGTSSFDIGKDERGISTLLGADYEASPEIRTLQDRLSALYGDSLGQAEEAQTLGMPLGLAGQGLFSLGAQYLAQSPQQARQQYLDEQYAMLDPVRQREEQRLASSVFGRGRAGLNIGDQGQPELFALASARRAQDAQLAAQADQAAQQRIGFGAGLFGTGAGLIGSQYGLQNQALAPFMTQFGAQQSLEQAALQPLQLSAELAGRAMNPTGANALLQGGLGAAQTQLQGALVGPSLMANTLSSFGQQYMQNQQQNQLFDRLYGPSSPAGMQSYYGFNPFSNTNTFAQQSQAGMFGTS